MSDRRQQQKAATAQRLFAAALELFAAQGYEATTVAQITAAAGVAKGTFFVHFASKQALLGHIGRRQMDRVYAAAAAPGFAAASLRDQLALIVRTLADGIADQPAQARALTVAILRHSLLDTAGTGIDELDAYLARLLAAAQARGALRPGLDLALAARLARTCYFQALYHWLSVGQTSDLRADAVAALDLLLGGLLAGAEGA